MNPYDHAVKSKTRFLALTGMRQEEFDKLKHLFQRELEIYLAEWTMEGYVREGRRYSQYKNCPLPRTEDKLFFILNGLKQGTTQEELGNKFGMSQANVAKWFHLLHEVLNLTLAKEDMLPARSASELKVYLAKESGKRKGEAGESEQAFMSEPEERQKPPFDQKEERGKKFSRWDRTSDQPSERPTRAERLL